MTCWSDGSASTARAARCKSQTVSTGRGRVPTHRPPSGAMGISPSSTFRTPKPRRASRSPSRLPPRHLQGAVSEFSGIAMAGALDQSAAASGNSTSVDSGATGPAGAGELVVGGIITGGQPGTVTPGSSQGQPFTMARRRVPGLPTSSTCSAPRPAPKMPGPRSAQPPTGMPAVATFVPASVPPPSVPTGLAATSDTTSSVGLSWTASTGGATGYTVYRNGTALGDDHHGHLHGLDRCAIDHLPVHGRRLQLGRHPLGSVHGAPCHHPGRRAVEGDMGPGRIRGHRHPGHKYHPPVEQGRGRR